MSGLYYIWTDDDRLVEVSTFPDTMTTNIRVGDDTIGGVRISTVFLRLNHDHFNTGIPVLFETMLFAIKGVDTRWDDFGEVERYRTPDEARAGHAKWVAAVKACEEPPPPEPQPVGLPLSIRRKIRIDK